MGMYQLVQNLDTCFFKVPWDIHSIACLSGDFLPPSSELSFDGE
jgi:hypothetical protein